VIGVQSPPRNFVEVIGNTGTHLSRPCHPSTNYWRTRQTRAGVARPLRGKRGVQHGAEPPRVNTFGVRLWLDALKCGADPDPDNDDTVIGEQHVVRVKDEVMYALAGGCRQRVGDRTNHESRFFGRQGPDRELFAERRAGQPPSDDEDSASILSGVNHAQHARVFDGRSELCCPTYRVGVRVPSIQQQHPDRAIKH